ncbi:hypothetical protein OG204_23465 [Streptomyces sp. NBC_01387]|uniref:hypothetical protein n=1 Tax=unclassified Streptomyces TaxID=2593676 RepID=UPI002025690B|nr:MULTISPECIES: hypothetical protein [unclassified Streptomyces]MCX4548722.1 hypothetical protein [Streptomyces sp. NBC_01500]WSC20315.1 hypothetical protein OIE60_11810 [Streptomyces sp. NBC_01766]WSV54349.1 hypothetical protein OG282_11870 [Streptomyces sp. NBC_01014]
MDRHELHAALRTAGVPDGYYRIEGVHEPVPTPPDFLFLRRTPDGGAWETGAFERGLYEIIGRYATEPDACAHLLQLLV